MFGGVDYSVLVAFLVKNMQSAVVCKYVADGQKPNQITNLRRAAVQRNRKHCKRAKKVGKRRKKVSFAQAIHFNGSFNYFFCSSYFFLLYASQWLF